MVQPFVPFVSPSFVTAYGRPARFGLTMASVDFSYLTLMLPSELLRLRIRRVPAASGIADLPGKMHFFHAYACRIHPIPFRVSIGL
jgi:hypothetical protein